MAGEIKRANLILYSLPGLPLAIPTIPVFVILPAFYAQSVGLGLTATGATLMAARLFDMLSDPLVGWACDRFGGAIGRRKLWIACGAPVAALALLMLFTPPAMAGAAYLLGWSALLYLGWTIIQIPYLAWGAELSSSYHERSRITGLREAFGLLGILLAGVLPLLAGNGGPARDLALLAWFTIAIGGATLLPLLLFLPEKRSKASGPPAAIRTVIAELSGNGPFLRLLSAWALNGVATGVAAALFPLYLEHVLAVEGWRRDSLILIYFLAAIAAVPGWLRLSRRIGKHRTWCVAMILACLAFLWVPLLGAGEVWLFLVVCLVTGAALGADLMLPPAMQADVIDWCELRNGENRAGLYFSLWGFGTKLALAFAIGAAFPILDLAGFDASAQNDSGALLALALIYATVPTVCKLAAISLMLSHPITPERHRAIMRRLQRRAARQARMPADDQACDKDPTPCSAPARLLGHDTSKFR